MSRPEHEVRTTEIIKATINAIEDMGIQPTVRNVQEEAMLVHGEQLALQDIAGVFCFLVSIGEVCN